MTEEHDNALAIAEMRGEMKAIRAENEAMESRIDAKLADLRTDMATNREDAAKRETRLILAMAVIVGVGLAIFGFITVPPSP
ncbi:MAG: hypothetical protein OXC63_08220 [Aestuariivita sp.]|nr:hypothetical protein [Aestuariivita sp.]MCY4345376.1 hypothetical protein [Aestuariivita sp.]MCY4345423.1 hypothetical protein [Aestuariivita sp.]